MKIHFLTFLASERHVWGFPFGPAYLSSTLRENSHQTSHILVHPKNMDDVLGSVEKSRADLLCYSTTTDTYPLAEKTSRLIHDLYEIPALLGGVHATVCPQEAIETPGIIGIARGESEHAVLELVEKINGGKDYWETRNFWFKKGGSTIKNPLRPLIQDLDNIPFPDRDIIDYATFLSQTDFGLEFISSRGCPYNCSFCINECLREIYGNPICYVRRRSVENLMEEIRQVTAKYPQTKSLSFHDDIFTTDQKWLSRFCEAYSREFTLPFRINSHVKTFSREAARLLSKAGCSQVAFGLESGDPHIRREILCKNVGDKDIKNAFKNARQHGIKTRAFNMIGVPEETERTIRKTITLNRKIKPDYVNAPIFRPYPETRIYKDCLEKGLLKKQAPRDFLNESIIIHEEITEEKLYFYKKAFNILVRQPLLEKPLILLEKIRLSKDKTLFDLAYTLKKKIF